jgi:hypothetical protein
MPFGNCPNYKSLSPNAYYCYPSMLRQHSVEASASFIENIVKYGC